VRAIGGVITFVILDMVVVVMDMDSLANIVECVQFHCGNRLGHAKGKAAKREMKQAATLQADIEYVM
jgi:hypothetical protein